jgi:hypothetical protein
MTLNRHAPRACFFVVQFQLRLIVHGRSPRPNAEMSLGNFLDNPDFASLSRRWAEGFPPQE